MHEVDQTTEQMVRSVLAYAENRLRMNPVMKSSVRKADPITDVAGRVGAQSATVRS